MKNSEYILYLDMDGVLVDFDQGFADIYYSIQGKMDPKAKEEAARRLYTQAGSQFWVDLDWEQGGKEVWDAASNLFETVGILSSASAKTMERFEVVTEGKRRWLKKNIPGLPDDHIFIVGSKSQKQNYADKLSILVDDKTSTIQQWNAKGGYGIVHKASQYKKTIEELEDISRPVSLAEIVKRFRK
jgi:5'(3')-deoxyribonucleotidase